MTKTFARLSASAVLFVSLMALPAIQAVNAQAGGGTATTGTTTNTNCADATSTGTGSTSPSPLFSPQADKYRFTITLPKLGYRFPCDQNLVSRVINFIISILTYVAGGVAFAYMIYGGIRYMTAGGDPSRVDAARKTIIGAIVGIFIVALAYVIVQYLIDTLVGVF